MPEDSQPTGNRYDQMFGEDSDNEEKLSVHESGDESDIGNRKRKRATNGDADVDADGDADSDKDEPLDELDDELFGDMEEENEKKPQYVVF